MNFGNSLILALLGIVVVSALVAGGVRYFSTEARVERRRRRSHSRLASKAKRPMVSFRVRTGK
jgi:hypothetical protein